MLVHQILRNKRTGDTVTTVTPGSTVADAARLLSKNRIGALVVTEDDITPAGILSERDIVREIGRRGTDCLEDHVSAMMTREVVTCGVEDLADMVLARMTERRIRHMPVMRDGRMIGLISIGDVVKARLDELSMEKEALKGMIMGY
ncbi:CBS domain-containing protein [Rhodobaculum claviforme]|uniref:Histidine kinase n=1 Tax=Rhodobaculum claviforme TaxID=1549854 RepID=A0A934TK31_9RHOB|nr:CBS domain-containing protein [Rhodobaculum claviforme]MBK5926667.1 histidine kinase [Rhodobaculum claviforme]